MGQAGRGRAAVHRRWVAALFLVRCSGHKRAQKKARRAKAPGPYGKPAWSGVDDAARTSSSRLIWDALLGLFGGIGQVVAAVRNILTGACHGIATGECCSPCNEKQSDESSHECSPFKNAFD